MTTLSPDPLELEPSAPAGHAYPHTVDAPDEVDFVDAAAALAAAERQGRLRVAREIAGATLRKAWNDRILGLSAEAAFWQLLSLPPLVLGVLGTLGYLGQSVGSAAVEGVERRLVQAAAGVLQPAVVDGFVRPTLDEVLQHGRGGVATASFLLCLWAGSSATSTFVNTTTIAYGQRDLRGAVRSRLLALWLYICALAVGMVAVPLFVLGPDALVAAVPERWHSTVAGLVHWAYWPVTAAVVFCALSTFYHLATPVRLRWRRAAPGAALALALFLLLAYGLQLYIGAVAERLLVFSTLAAPVLVLLYFYVLAFAVLLGAELNATLEQRWPRGAKPRPLHTLRARVRQR